ncbi:MAG: DUF3316 domain-containing protein [Bacteroidales bacterium]|nr:DUF3316 domain-containing protein [Bacteroidales bacterium]
MTTLNYHFSDIRRTVALAASLICCILAYPQADSTSTVRATSYGVGYANVLDTYLSPLEYTGPEVRAIRESIRHVTIAHHQVLRQSLFQLNVAMLDNQAKNGSEIYLLANWNHTWFKTLLTQPRLRVLAGPQLAANIGMLYNVRNSNNPVQAKAYVNAGVGGMATYQTSLMGLPLYLRYQLSMPLLGMMFSPEYGQAYYELSLSHDWSKNLCFTSLHNQPSIRQLVSCDFPIGKFNLRLTYSCDLQQSKVNHLKSHAWSHTLLLGVVKQFSLTPYSQHPQ